MQIGGGQEQLAPSRRTVVSLKQPLAPVTLTVKFCPKAESGIPVPMTPLTGIIVGKAGVAVPVLKKTPGLY